MSDERLRELERRWRESGSVEDEAAWLLERVRVGELDQDRLELAAYCGHGAARVALGDAAARPAEDFDQWAAGLEQWSTAPPALPALPRLAYRPVIGNTAQPLLVRVALASTSSLLARDCCSEAARTAWFAAAQYAFEATPAGSSAAAQAGWALEEEEAAGLAPDSAIVALVAAFCSDAKRPILSLVAHLCKTSREEARARLARPGGILGAILSGSASLTSADTVRDAVARDLGAYALGPADPLEEALERRPLRTTCRTAPPSPEITGGVLGGGSPDR